MLAATSTHAHTTHPCSPFLLSLQSLWLKQRDPWGHRMGGSVARGLQGICIHCIDLRARSQSTLTRDETHDPWGEGPGAPGRPSFSPGGELGAGQCLLINLLLTGKSCAEVPISSQSEQNFPGMPPERKLSSNSRIISHP